jgi:microcin C transport system substrate-binding protein
MSDRFNYLRRALLGALTLCLLGGCGDEKQETERSLGFDEFVPVYNAYIKKWVASEHSRVQKSMRDLEEKIEQSEGEEKADHEISLSDVRRELGRLEYRQELGDYFSFKKEEDLPQGLQWDEGMNEPEIGDPRAIKGGAFNYYMMEFPPTVRQFGREANNSFRSEIYDNIEVALTGLHPLTMKVIPGTARRWAVSEDGHTVFYELDPDARYNDGHTISVKDYMVGIYLRVSDNVSAPFEKQYFREQFSQVTSYGEKYLAVTLPEKKPLMPYYGALAPSPSHFFSEYGADFVDRYQWKVAPHSGAYYVKDKDIVKGVSITLTRDKGWWAKDKKYYRHRFNPDKMVFTVIRDESKAFELFRAGQLDVFGLTRPRFWYEKSEIKPVFDGYIERYKFYNQFPRSPRGAYLNLARPMLKDLDMRKGIDYALHWQKCIDVIFRGDYERLQQFSVGFGEMTNPNIKARQFSVIKARQHFAKAGYTQEGKDGILRKPSGERLAVNLSYPNVAYYPRLVAVLKEEAKKAGLEIRADGLENTVFYKKVMKKEHDICIWAWGTTPPYPRYYQSFFSKNAFDNTGQPKPQTNNINSYANPQMDKYCKGVRYARTAAELKENAWNAQQLIHDEALFSPGWVTNFSRVGSWRWLRWPDTKDTPFCVPVVYSPLESYCYWIDDEIKEETQKAMRLGKTFPEVQKIIDDFKEGIPQQDQYTPEPKQEGTMNHE